MKHLLKSLFTCVLVCSAIFLSAQGTVRGFIKVSASGQPLSSILVGLEGTTYGTRTDENGFYSLSRVTQGEYTLIIANIEFKPVKEKITVTNEKVITRNYLLEKDEKMLGEIEVTADGQEQRNNVNVSVETIRPQDMVILQMYHPINR